MEFAKVLVGVAGMALALWAPLPDAAAAELTLKRVLLSTGGVGYFEHEAVVDGNATLELEVRLDQVDDVLKSIVVFDDTVDVDLFDRRRGPGLAHVGEIASGRVLIDFPDQPR